MKLKLTILALVSAALAGSGVLFADTADSVFEPHTTDISRFIIPGAYRQNEYQNALFSTVAANGPFDNFKISGNGFCETDITVNPRNQLNYICVDNNIQLNNGTGCYYTTDGGLNWSPSTGVQTNLGDPVVSFDSLGNCYLSLLQNGVIVYKSTNQGVSFFSLGTVVSNANADKEWIAADRTGGIYKDYVYMAYVNVAAGTSVDFWRSTNNGSNWAFMSRLGAGIPNPGPNIATGPNGKVYIAWYNGSGTSAKFSTDGGATFSAEIPASEHNTPGVLGLGGRYVIKNNIRVNGMPHIAVDNSGSIYRGNVYCVYAGNPPGPDAANVYLTRTTNGGVSWNVSSAIKLNDDNTNTDQFMCDVSVDNAGRVWAVWYDSRNDPNNVWVELYAAVSTNGGASFMPNFRVSNSAFDANASAIGQTGDANYIGDYQGISGTSVTIPAWMDNRAGGHPDFTAWLPDYGMSFSKTADTIMPGGTSVNTLRIPVMGPYTGIVTFTAAVNPTPSPGTISVNFLPNNTRTLNGITDSMSVQVITTANIPDNFYTISVTGTESGGVRTHTRSFVLLATRSIGIQPVSNEIPATFVLYQNYPNPFNPDTRIRFSIPQQITASLHGDGGMTTGVSTRLTIYNTLGIEVKDLFSGGLKPGTYEIDWDASAMPSGIYFYKLSAGDFTATKKMLLIK
jgi:hypothetical protein